MPSWRSEKGTGETGGRKPHIHLTLRWTYLHPACVWRSQSETSPCGRSSDCIPECLQADRDTESLFPHRRPSFLSLDLDGIMNTPFSRPQVADTYLPLLLSFPLWLLSTFEAWHHFSSVFLSCSCNYCDHSTLPLPPAPFLAFCAVRLFIFICVIFLHFIHRFFLPFYASTFFFILDYYLG